ncbi:MAG: GyrI-like domain-containing protein [Acidobacteriota bacterium]|nr:GyrI-like domain-containing protein [Acidobacteriota bacterium]
MRATTLGLWTTLLFVVPVAAAGSDAADEVRVRVLPSRVDAVLDHTGPYTGLADAFLDLLDWIEAGRWIPVGRGVGVFHDDPTRVPAPKLRAEARIPINVYGGFLPRPPPGEVGARLERTEPLLVASALHVGPYDRVLPVIDRILGRLPRLGLKVAGPEMERYLNDPADTPPEALETEVLFPVAPRRKEGGRGHLRGMGRISPRCRGGLPVLSLPPA